MYVYVCMCVCVCMYVCMYVCMCVYVCMYVCIYVCVCVGIEVAVKKRDKDGQLVKKQPKKTPSSAACCPFYKPGPLETFRDLALVSL